MLTKSVANPVHSGQDDHFLAHEKKIHIFFGAKINFQAFLDTKI